MSFKIKYLLFVYVTIIVLFLLTGCSIFGEKMKQNQQLMENQQLICSPSYETLCAGWKI